MNRVVDEMNDILMHYGMPRRSGRYPWGSGENPYQGDQDFIARVEELRAQGVTYTDPKTGKTYTGDTAVAKHLNLTTDQFRTEIALAKNTRRLYDVARVKSLTEDGLGATEIGKIMGISESTVRSLRDTNSEARMKQAFETANFIKEQVDKKGMIDVGAEVNRELGISEEKMKQALYLLQREGYPVYGGGVPQATNPGKQTNLRVICPPGTEHKEIYNSENVHSLMDYVSHDGGDTFKPKFTYPESMDSKRLMIRYNEDGGIDKDGIIELRRGVPDLSLGESRYSQVRILVDHDKYLKGMALYSDDMPDGVDVIFNTNKKRGTPMEDVLKKIKPDPDNPFGSLIKDADQGGQYWYTDKDGKEKLGLINKRADEGDWTDWKDALPSQFLSKQSKSLAEKQLKLAAADKSAEFDDICSITNPTIKRHFLQKFAEECDSAAVHMQAAALPNQKYHVIIPINSLSDKEVYAPKYKNGTKLALIRYPHGGTFEIPILTVNNKHPEAIKLLGTDIDDAVGINKRVADRLSGADFDGDTVMCIPTHDKQGRVKIASKDYLKGLEGFDPKIEYPERPGMKYMKNPVTGKDRTPVEMGMISNLICDMTLGGATDDELAAAVRHSMVVIDAGKHKLDYEKSAIDNNIAALKRKYQIRVDENGEIKYGGASTIISRASGEMSVLKKQGSGVIDPDTGKITYKIADDVYYPDRSYDKSTGIVTIRTANGKKVSYNVNDEAERERYAPVKRVDDTTGEVTFTNKDGDITYRRKTRMQKSTRMAETDDAYTLVSEARHPMELVYADYANTMKAMANRARKELISTGNLKTNDQAKKTYQAEVSSLKAKLNTALLNKPRERLAQLKTNAEISAKIEADPTMKPGDIKKAKQMAISKYRDQVGSITRRKRLINITDREWEAIQAGAISDNLLTKILDNADVDALRQRATPRASKTLSAAQINKIKAMRASNYSLNEIAEACNISASSVSKYLKGEN